MSSSSSEVEIIMVCQVPECFAIGDEWIIGEHLYFYCPDHATELGWCYSCEEYVGAGKLYAQDLCEGCYETAAPISEAIDDVLAREPQCPHCESTNISQDYSEGGGWCHACEQMFDEVKGDG